MAVGGKGGDGEVRGTVRTCVVGVGKMLASTADWLTFVNFPCTQGRTTQSASDDAHPQCTASLHFARDSAKAGSGLDEHGVVGFVCSDGVPMRKAFIQMYTPEQMAYYKFGLDAIFKERRVQLFGLDIACRFQPHLCSRFGNDVYPGLTFATGAMHGAGHIHSCQMHNLVVFKEGFGWPVMEQSEQLWAELKAPAKNFR